MSLKLQEKQTEVLEPELERSELPLTWGALAKQLDVDPACISNTARSLLAAQGSNVPSKIPSPRALGVNFVTLIVNSVTKASSTSKRHSIAAAVVTADKSKIVREAIDKAVDLLGVGNGVIEYVADQLCLPIKSVQKVFKERHDALMFERSVADLEQKRDHAIQQRKFVAESAKLNAKADAREAAKLTAPLPTPKPKPPPQRPAEMPEAHEDNELDSFMRAAWIARRAGIPRAEEDAVKALVTRFGGKVKPEEALEAIDAAYTARPEAGRRQMERRAERLAKEAQISRAGADHK